MESKNTYLSSGKPTSTYKKLDSPAWTYKSIPHKPWKPPKDSSIYSIKYSTKMTSSNNSRSFSPHKNTPSKPKSKTTYRMYSKLPQHPKKILTISWATWVFKSTHPGSKDSKMTDRMGLMSINKFNTAFRPSSATQIDSPHSPTTQAFSSKIS